jgi:hypothetical protein
MTIPPSRHQGTPEGDPWAAFGYLVAGVVFYGGIGWLLKVWLGQTFWLPLGLLVGAGLGMYMVFARFRFREPDGAGDRTQSEIGDTTAEPTARSDRGDTE